MSYDGIKDNILTILGDNGYAESSVAFNPENLSSGEYENTAIISVVSGENIESLVDRIRDLQIWEIKIVYAKSEVSDIIQRDQMNRSISALVKNFDNPSNWQGVTNGAYLQRYQGFNITEETSYYLLTIALEIQDELTY